MVLVDLLEGLDLHLGLVRSDAVGLLQLPGQLVALARDGVEVIVGESPPLLLDEPLNCFQSPIDARVGAIAGAENG